jgi:hypothetical protein
MRCKPCRRKQNGWATSAQHRAVLYPRRRLGGRFGGGSALCTGGVGVHRGATASKSGQREWGQTRPSRAQDVSHRGSPSPDRLSFVMPESLSLRQATWHISQAPEKIKTPIGKQSRRASDGSRKVGDLSDLPCSATRRPAIKPTQADTEFTMPSYSRGRGAGETPVGLASARRLL